MKILIGAFIATVLLFGFLLLSRKEQPTITIHSHAFSVEIADTSDERTKGLSGRTNLDENTGMLFVFEEPGHYSFWMKDTLIPLDIIFIKNNRIVTIYKNAQPQGNISDNQLQRYSPREPVNYVLEINGGLSEKYGFEEEDVVVMKDL